MRWKFPIYNEWGQLVKNLYVRYTCEVHNQLQAEHVAEDYVDANHPMCHIAYDEITKVLDNVEVTEATL